MCVCACVMGRGMTEKNNPAKGISKRNTREEEGLGTGQESPRGSEKGKKGKLG